MQKERAAATEFGGSVKDRMAAFKASSSLATSDPNSGSLLLGKKSSAKTSSTPGKLKSPYKESSNNTETTSKTKSTMGVKRPTTRVTPSSNIINNSKGANNGSKTLKERNSLTSPGKLKSPSCKEGSSSDAKSSAAAKRSTVPKSPATRSSATSSRTSITTNRDATSNKTRSASPNIKDRAKALQKATEEPTLPVTNHKPPQDTAKVGSLKAKTKAFQEASAIPKTPPPVRTSSAKASSKQVAKAIASAKKNAAKSLSPTRPRPLTPPPPKKSSNLLDKKGRDDTISPTTVMVSKLSDKSLEQEVRDYVHRIEAAGGFPQQRRLSVRDNDIVSDFTKVIANDPSVTTIAIDSDPRFAHTSPSLIVAFAEGLRGNLHLTTLTITNVELGNDFLSALATSMETNFVLQTLNLSKNHFTNDALIEFCQAVGSSNETLTTIDLSQQMSPIFDNAQDQVLEALEQNRTIQTFRVEFKSDNEGPKRLKAILERNQANPPEPVNGDQRLLKFLKEEAERAEELFEQRKAEEEILQVKDDDWDYLYELSELFDRYKLQDEVDLEGGSGDYLDPKSKSPPGRNKSFGRNAPPRGKSGPLEGMMGFTADGSFLTHEFIDKYLVENEECKSLVFDFCNQFKLFKRFPMTDPARQLITAKLIDAILTHPRMKDITGLNLVNSCCGNDLFQILADRCLADHSLLPNLNMINAETNYIGEAGVKALSKCISNPNVFKYLQVLKLENQRHLMSSKGELALAKALCVNRGIVRFSLRIRNLLERQQINKYVVRNIDFLRQARRHHAIKTGTLDERKRNDMEQFFDKIAANDPSITKVECIGSQRFLTLTEEEKVKSGAAFANNTNVKEVQMSMLHLDDNFAIALGRALETCCIEKLNLDSNAIAGDGMKALFEGLAKNKTIVELQVRHQSKVTCSADEDLLPELLEPNNTITKLGVDLRSQLARIKIDKKMNQNRELQRKRRVNSK